MAEQENRCRMVGVFEVHFDEGRGEVKGICREADANLNPVPIRTIMTAPQFLPAAAARAVRQCRDMADGCPGKDNCALKPFASPSSSRPRR